MTIEDCIFCNIVEGEALANVVYEDEFVMSFLPLKFANPGQTLVIPKIHVENFLELEFRANIAGHLLSTCAYIGNALKKATGAQGMNLITSQGSVATQTVWHLHFHLVPRFHADGFPLWGHSEDIPADDRKALVHSIKENL